MNCSFLERYLFTVFKRAQDLGEWGELKEHIDQFSKIRGPKNCFLGFFVFLFFGGFFEFYNSPELSKVTLYPIVLQILKIT